MTKYTTMVIYNMFRFTRLFVNGSSNLVLFSLNLWHWGLIWPIIPQWWQVGTNLDPFKTIGWDLNGGFDLRPFLSTFWFLLCGGTYTDLSFEVEHIIDTKSGTTTWLQLIFSSFLAIGSTIKHLACICRYSFSHFSSSTKQV